jgi:hypothetical protein
VIEQSLQTCVAVARIFIHTNSHITIPVQRSSAQRYYRYESTLKYNVEKKKLEMKVNNVPHLLNTEIGGKHIGT